jgi:cytochrome c oxidase cbb3-type subunit 3
MGVSIKMLNQMKNDKAEGEKLPDSWDEITEFNNPIPKGWGYSFLASIVFAVAYIVFIYPLDKFSQIGQYNEEVIASKSTHADIYKNTDPKKIGESIFLVKCISCHGVMADGMNGVAQNLVKWSTEEHIEDVIRNGSQGIKSFPAPMPGGMASGDDVKAIAAYVSSSFLPSKTTKNPELVAKGKVAFETACFACHGKDGHGVVGLAPDLHNLVSEVLTSGKIGKIGEMPSFSSVLSKEQKKALSAYVYSLNN